MRVLLLYLLSRWEKSLEDQRSEYRMGFPTQRGAFFLEACGCFRSTMNAAADDFHPWVGGLVQGHIALDGFFSEECFPCLRPTTVLVVLPDARLHILFTTWKRRTNEEIEAHSLHTSSLLDADLSPFVQQEFVC